MKSPNIAEEKSGSNKLTVQWNECPKQFSLSMTETYKPE